MYQVDFATTSAAGWAQAVELIDADTNLPLEVDEDATFALQVDDNCGNSMLSASTEAGTITMPEDNVVQWRFLPADLGSFCRGHTYSVGLVMTTTEGPVQIFLGTLVFLDGVVGS
jgi:hypothetical protein